MRKKLICILAGLTVAVGLVGCGQKKAVEETTVATSETGSESSTVLKGTASQLVLTGQTLLLPLLQAVVRLCLTR